MKIIKRPVLTEKSIKEYKESNKVTFEVDLNTNKNIASQVLEKVYGVKVESVNVVTRLGKTRIGRKTRRPEAKKANSKIMVFRLSSKDKIDIFDQ